MRGRSLQIAWRPEDTFEALKAAYRAEPGGPVRTRVHCLWLLRTGRSLRLVAELLGTHYRSVQRWVAWYREGGLPAVRGHRMGGVGQPSFLTATAQAEIAEVVASGQEHQVDLIGPVYDDRQWQAKAAEGFDLAHVRIDWDARVVTCPQGQRSAGWSEASTARPRSQIHVQFSPDECLACPVRPQCTRAKCGPRHLTLRSRAEHEALLQARERQGTPTFRSQYAARARIEATYSLGVRSFGLRPSRSRGLAKTHLQQVATAAAINLDRLVRWFEGLPRISVRPSHFAALANPI